MRIRVQRFYRVSSLPGTGSGSACPVCAASPSEAVGGLVSPVDGPPAGVLAAGEEAPPANR